MEVYMDSAASTKVKPEVLAEFDKVVTSLYGNPSSEHNEGQLAKECIDVVKSNIAHHIHCDANDVFFTTGATMSNQLLIQGFVAKNPHGMVITTNVEHNDIIMLMDNLDCYKHILKVGEDGTINTYELYKVVEYASTQMNIPVLVSIQMANSETGIIQPIQRIVGNIKEFDNVFVHMDATQYVPYYPINMDCWGLDAISMSGQKIGGIKGSGLLVVRQTLRDNIKPIIYGEQGLIGGTPSTPLIASLGVAFDLLNYDMDSLHEKTNYLLSKLQDIGGVLVGGLDNRLPNNIYIRFPGVNGLRIVKIEQFF